MTIVVIDYGSGNLRSAKKAFEFVVGEIGLNEQVLVTGRVEALLGASHIILPGVGAFADCRSGIGSIDGMLEALEHVVMARGCPLLAICVGMQLLGTRSLENGDHAGFDWISGEVLPIPRKLGLPIPQMGWNDLVFHCDHPVTADLNNGDHAYFVHSFMFSSDDHSRVLATVDYGAPINAIIMQDNIVGTQFHPEKSQATGMKLIRNFLTWRP